MIILFALGCLNARAQYVLDEARNQSNLYNYARAIPLYEKAYRKKETAEAARGAAEAYYKQRDFSRAESWYATLYTLKDHTPQDEFRYAQTLIRNAKYADAKALLLKLDTTKILKNATLVSRMIVSCDSATYWINHPLRGELVNLHQLNSSKSDWGAITYNGEIVFSSDRPTTLKMKRPFFRNSNIKRETYGWTGDSYQHLYSSKEKDSASISMFDTTLVKEYYHTAGASFTADEKEMFFAGTRYIRKKAKFLGKEPFYDINIEIYYSHWDTIANRWGHPVAFPYNDVFENSLGDPFISPDGRTLYFISDAPADGFGGTDIYYSKRVNDTGWTQPVNMGSDINTPGNERTPLFDSNGNFYFASDGRAGIGGLDIYKASPTTNGGWQVVNAGAPINSPQDDFSPFFKRGYRGYFASNRPSGIGSDDLYEFNALLILEGEVLHTKTGAAINSAEVTLNDLTKSTPVKVVTDADGKFSFTLSMSTDYSLNAVKPGLIASAVESFSTVHMEDSTVIHRTLYLNDIPPVVPVSPVVAIENIYYNFDKSNIRRDAVNPLEHIVQLMKAHPNWHLNITSHTDSRGSDKYNLKLSERRARAALQYLITHGIDESRLTARGYGETKLVNKCSNEVPCSAEEHQLNRRSEFEIMKKSGGFRISDY
ncbi:OmpA family protein [Chitinophaga sp. RCC_12]|uniref:OmpA family protein n=1 Tax=Chitinophaga sp. RCC_12 TaxID=3239226 RepID=UPI003525A55A